jgi:Na+/melibiose symporter-like transporter
MLIGLTAVVAVIVVSKKRSQLLEAGGSKAFTISIIVCACISLALWIPCYFATHARVTYLLSTVDESGRDLRSRFVTDEDRNNPCRLFCKLIVILAVLPCELRRIASHHDGYDY